MQSPYQTGLAETMQAPQGQDAYDVYEKLFAMFAPEFSSPSEDWRKQAMANAIGMAGSAMLGGDTFSQGQAAAFPAFHQSMYGQEQDEQRRLDLRSREDALSRYRAGSLAGMGEGPQEQENKLFTAMMSAYPEHRELLMSTGGDEVALRRILEDITAPEEAGMGEEDWSVGLNMTGKRPPREVDPAIGIKRKGELLDLVPYEMRDAFEEQILQAIASLYGISTEGIGKDELVSKMEQMILDKGPVE
jgi:hypothetical protein